MSPVNANPAICKTSVTCAMMTMVLGPNVNQLWCDQWWGKSSDEVLGWLSTPGRERSSQTTTRISCKIYFELFSQRDRISKRWVIRHICHLYRCYNLHLMCFSSVPAIQKNQFYPDGGFEKRMADPNWPTRSRQRHFKTKWKRLLWRQRKETNSIKS